MSESMYWLWPDGDGFLIFQTRYPVDENGDPKVYGEPAAGPLSLYEAQRYMDRAICDAPYRQRGATMPSRELGNLGLSERWHAESTAARPHAGEMLTYLRGLLVDPSHPVIRRCAQKLIDEIEKSAHAGIPPVERGDG